MHLDADAPFPARLAQDLQGEGRSEWRLMPKRQAWMSELPVQAAPVDGAGTHQRSGPVPRRGRAPVSGESPRIRNP